MFVYVRVDSGHCSAGSILRLSGWTSFIHRVLARARMRPIFWVSQGQDLATRTNRFRRRVSRAARSLSGKTDRDLYQVETGPRLGAPFGGGSSNSPVSSACDLTERAKIRDHALKKSNELRIREWEQVPLNKRDHDLRAAHWKCRAGGMFRSASERCAEISCLQCLDAAAPSGNNRFGRYANSLL